MPRHSQGPSAVAGLIRRSMPQLTPLREIQIAREARCPRTSAQRALARLVRDGHVRVIEIQRPAGKRPVRLYERVDAPATASALAAA